MEEPSRPASRLSLAQNYNIFQEEGPVAISLKQHKPSSGTYLRCPVQFNCGGRSIKQGLIAVDIVSHCAFLTLSFPMIVILLLECTSELM